MTDYRLTNLKDITCKTNGTILGLSCVLTTFGDVLGYIDINPQDDSWVITTSELLIAVPNYSIVDFDVTGPIISCVGIKANESQYEVVAFFYNLYSLPYTFTSMLLTDTTFGNSKQIPFFVDYLSDENPDASYPSLIYLGFKGTTELTNYKFMDSVIELKRARRYSELKSASLILGGKINKDLKPLNITDLFFSKEFDPSVYDTTGGPIFWVLVGAIILITLYLLWKFCAQNVRLAKIAKDGNETSYNDLKATYKTRHESTDSESGYFHNSSTDNKDASLTTRDLML